MVHLNHQLELLAKQELAKLNISGSVEGVCFIYNKSCSMIRITFCSDIEPKPVLQGADYIEKDYFVDTIWYLYMEIDMYTFE